MKIYRFQYDVAGSTKLFSFLNLKVSGNTKSYWITANNSKDAVEKIVKEHEERLLKGRIIVLKPIRLFRAINVTDKVLNLWECMDMSYKDATELLNSRDFVEYINS